MRTRVRSHRRRNLAIILVVGLAYVAWCLLKPLPQLTPDKPRSTLSIQTPASAIAWPTSQAAVTVVGTGIVETKGGSKSVPTASTAKIITALMVLKQKPLQLGQQGPIITLTDKDVAIYKDYVARDGSVVPVLAGEQITEYQALQTVMLPSANNMADSLAIWAYGSLSAYKQAANEYLKSQGLQNTTVGADASGLAADSTSTAQDLAQLGALAMQNPVLAQIAGQSTATGIPIVGTIKNVNDLIGINGIVGVKTGNSEEAGGAFVSAAKTIVNKKPIVITTAVVDAPTLFIAMKETLPLTKSAQSNFSPVSIVKKGETVGKYTLPWGGTVEAVAGSGLSISAWNGSTVTAPLVLEAVPATSQSGQRAGYVSVNKSAINNKLSAPVVLKSAPSQPSTWWRLAHPTN